MKLSLSQEAEEGRARRWAGLVGLAGAALALIALRFIDLPDAPSGAHPSLAGHGFKAPGLVLIQAETTSTSDALGERLRLLDPTPLFFPVERDGLVFRSDSFRDSSGDEAVRWFPPLLRYAGGLEVADLMRPPVPDPAQAAAELIGARWFQGLARTGAVEAPVVSAENTVGVKLFRVGTGELVTARRVTLSPELVSGSWRPLRLMVLVDEVGEVGLPSLVAGSGVDEVDEVVRELAGRDWVPAARLRPGIYRLEVGL